ncbi:MAG: histidine--tRNA ligase [Polyangiaceae bacterium]
MSAIRAPKGMNDILPDESGRWHVVERAFGDAMGRAGFREVRTPYLESTNLFVRTIGEATDVVEKEMYSFSHHDEPLTLRPEGTAGAARAYVEHGIHNKEPASRWYYAGPMFRAERPQKGRYRQFYQLGAEVFGDTGPGVDAEVIDLLVRFFQSIGIPDVDVLVNCIGGPETRASYKEALVKFLEPKLSGLSADSQRRLHTNPLRILDSKNPADIAAVADAPTLTDHLSADDKKHFDGLRRMLDALATPYRVEPRLVRGLDYYTRTLFEVKAAKEKLGAGDTIAGGGRYDNMLAELGGNAQPAFGFAAGLERLLIASEVPGPASVVDVFIAPMGEAAHAPALVLARKCRDAGIAAEADLRGASMKSLLRRANALGAAFAVIIGDRELETGHYGLKDLAAHTQSELAPEALVAHVKASRAARKATQESA